MHLISNWVIQPDGGSWGLGEEGQAKYFLGKALSLVTQSTVAGNPWEFVRNTPQAFPDLLRQMLLGDTALGRRRSLLHDPYKLHIPVPGDRGTQCCCFHLCTSLGMIKEYRTKRIPHPKPIPLLLFQI